MWARVDKTLTDWLWTGPLDRDGYGGRLHGDDGVGIKPHRLALEEAMGAPIPAGFQALHTCDVRHCVRNDDAGWYEVNGVVRRRWGHLWLGTTADNTADRDAKGRTARGDRAGAHVQPDRILRGEHHPESKLTVALVLEIRQRASDITVDRGALALVYGVNRSTINRIVSRRAWMHVP